MAEIQKGGAATLHVFIPTLGRSTVLNMLASLQGELTHKDYLTVAFDGEDRDSMFQQVRAVVKNITRKGKVYMTHNEYLAASNEFDRHEHGLRNAFISGKVSGDFCLFGDDDDRYVPGFAQSVRDAVSIDPSGLFFFRMFRHAFNDTIWRSPYVQIANIGTPNGVVPCSKLKSSVWGGTQFGDGDYWVGMAQSFPRHYLVDKVIYLVGEPP